MDNKDKKSKGSIHTIEYSRYTSPTILPAVGKKWTTNGENNSFYYYIKECYNGSPTNAAIINAYVNYIVGEGLVDNNKANVYKYVSKADLKKMVLDFKTYGSFAYQVIWNSAEGSEKKPIRIKHLSVIKLGLNINKNNQVDGYWYSFDWANQSKYKPVFYPKFDGVYKKKDEDGNGWDVEIMVVNRTSTELYFPNPDYLPALQYCELEMELANSSINHIKNGFSATKVVNVPFKPESEELEEEYASAIKSKTTGSNNQADVIIAFNEKPEMKLSVDAIEVTELNAQYVHFEEISKTQIIVAHSAPPILFSGSREGGGLGNNSEELKTQKEELYQKNINPLREDILEGLRYAFSFIDNTLDLRFKDFGEKDNDDSAPVQDVRTLDAQAQLRGSVGGVDAILKVQESYSLGTTSYMSAIAIFKNVFGFSEEQSKELLGNPEKQV